MVSCFEVLLASYHEHCVSHSAKMLHLQTRDENDLQEVSTWPNMCGLCRQQRRVRNVCAVEAKQASNRGSWDSVLDSLTLLWYICGSKVVEDDAAAALLPPHLGLYAQCTLSNPSTAWQ